MDQTANKLVTFSRKLQFEDLSRRAIVNAKARLINCLGVSIGAHDAPTVKIIRKLAYPSAIGPLARTFTTLTPTTPDLAAFVNSAMTRYLDMADTYVPVSYTHLTLPTKA